MAKLIPVVALLCVFSPIGGAASSAPDEGVEIKLQPEWKPTFDSHTRKLTLLEFVQEGDDAHHWKELLSVENAGAQGSSNSLEKILDHVRGYREKVCPGATTEFNVIHQDESSILYEWQAKPCLGWPEQREIGRMISGTHDWFFLHYAARGREIAPGRRAQVIEMFSAATVDSTASALVPSAGNVNVDEVVPFEMDKVAAAVKPAMEMKNCSVTEATASRVECKRSRGWGYGGESVTAELEEQGGQTRVRITTGLGVVGRTDKRNWSIPIYEEMVRILQSSQSRPD
jgi:hypothetical protein